MSNDVQKAVVYCRVSSGKQVDEGHGLDGQERACRAWTDRNNYKVVNVFREEGVSGGIFDRPALVSLFTYLKDHDDVSMVIFEDTSRIARDVSVHLQIAAQIKKLGSNYQTRPPAQLNQS